MPCSAEIRRNCQTLMDSNRNWDERPDAGLKGIYVIKEDKKIIYVGRSKNIRDRLNAHFSRGDQAIGEYINTRGKVFRDSHFTVSWVKDAGQQCNEHCYIKIIEELQRGRPRFNMQHGNACD